MKEHSFFTEIAFIPWNYRRSDMRTAQLFAENPDYFGICVHGCNHTANEFGGMDYGRLSALSSTALWRMEEHRKLTGLPYDPVLVFPQGSFSSVAMLALKDQGYRAAFNSTIKATDGADPPATEYRLPATTVYHDFPLFLRRYPKDKSGFIQDLASGRPIIIVEHHAAFRNGYKAMTDSVDWVNSLGNIRWTSLQHIVDHYCGATDSLSLKTSNEVVWNEGKVALRRYACEFRDNYIETNDVLSKLYRMARGIRTVVSV